MQHIDNATMARIYGAYINCRMKQKEGIIFHGNRHSINAKGELIMSPSIIADCWEGTFNYDDFQLMLTPLSKITDEDAIEVAKLCMNWPKQSENNYEDDVKDFEYIVHQIKILFREWNKGYEVFFDVFRVKLSFIIKIVDYLRSKGYMIPYMGIDLFETGIAVEKQNNNGK